MPAFWPPSLDLQCSSDDENEDGFQDGLSEEDSPNHSQATLNNPIPLTNEQSVTETEVVSRPTENPPEGYLDASFIKTEMKLEPGTAMTSNLMGKEFNYGL